MLATCVTSVLCAAWNTMAAVMPSTGTSPLSAGCFSDLASPNAAPVIAVNMLWFSPNSPARKSHSDTTLPIDPPSSTSPPR
jgi:hypothetical protein